MRLICPNCDAQYEVPDDVMPFAGRDVQCSNCGQTWFQHHPDNTPTDQSGLTDAPAPDEEQAPPPPPPPPPAGSPQRKQLDPAVADILRQEAEAEQAARRNLRADGLESQPDLGMELEDSREEDETERRAREARDRMARMRGKETPHVPTAGSTPPKPQAPPVVGSRRDLLPDIEEINSTLRSDAGRGGSADLGPVIEAPSNTRKRQGFRTGFVTMLLIFAVLAVIYIFAPRLSAAVPALEGPLNSYVGVIDEGRSWLDAKVQVLLKSLDTAAEGSGS
ncbi:zinc-ribbon domain-containing protein [Sulfitobacter guttiformis]|nr:zinc-ribbon domain-containing protein [Sulfitobacter guttiformis]